MLTKYKNQLFDSIKESTFALNQFKYEEFKSDGNYISRINYIDTPFYFYTKNPSNSYKHFQYKYTTFSPGYESTDYIPNNRWVGIDSILRSFRGWLDKDISEYLAENVAIDLWTEFKNTGSSLNLNNIDFDDKDSFTVEEQKQINLALDELKLLIKDNFKTNQEQQSNVNNRLDYLIEGSKRLNKVDWKSIAISTMISISIALTLDAEQGQLLFSLFKKVINALPKLIMGN